MTIDASELKYYRAAVNQDGGANGGRLSAVELPSGAQFFPHTTVDERANGITRHRKLFAKLADPENGILYLAKLAESRYTATGDAVYLHIGTQDDVEDDLTGTEPLLGCGYLTNSAIAGATSIDVTVEDGSVTIFRDGEKVLLENDTLREYAVLSAAPTVSGNVVTLLFVAGLTNGYSGGIDVNGYGLTRVASVYEHGDLEPTLGAETITSAAGTFDPAQVALSNIGAIDQALTFTFSSATAFDVTSDTGASLGSGNITTDFAPENPDFIGYPFLTVPSAAWGGTWAAGDTATLPTQPAAIPVWAKLVVPALTAGGQVDWEVVVDGEAV